VTDGQISQPPPERAAGLRAIGERLLAARTVALMTHVNADGDGAGSQSAVAAWLESRGVHVTITNPTPFPPGLRFLLPRPDMAPDPGTPEAQAAIARADLVLVLDTSEPNRVAPLDALLRPDRTAVIDHHPPGPVTVGDMAVQDPTAAATGELAYDLFNLFGPEIPPAAVLGVYVAIVSDTGSFRFSNTNPRVHRIAADLLARGADPELVFQRLYATFPRRRLDLLREALGTLETDEAHGISWIVIPNSTATRLQATAEDFEGLVDHARSIEGTEVAILFRETPDGHTKLSLRSNGDVDVNRIARDFGGGGHVKAAGAFVPEAPRAVVPRVVDRVRGALREE
jgi:bifunctional oligoribonuclease and PAP phosphatase NrnA